MKRHRHPLTSTIISTLRDRCRMSTAFDPNELVSEQGQGRPLHQKAIDWFTENGVNGLALAKTTWGHFDFVNIDEIVRLLRKTFEFGRYKRNAETTPACTFLVRDQFVEPMDIVAWQATTGRVATWLGRAALIGEDQLFAPRLVEGLQVHETPLEWFRERRAGVVVIDKNRAVAKLRDAAPLLVSSFEHGEKLQEMLRATPPRILVPSSTEQEAA
jgi:hypothetical protein